VMLPAGFAFNEAQLVKVFADKGYTIETLRLFGPMGVIGQFLNPGRIKGSVVISQADNDDGIEWLHASLAYSDRDPSYTELMMLHRGVFGRKRWSYQVFAPEGDHVSIHDHALHLWGRADGVAVLPNFGEHGSI